MFAYASEVLVWLGFDKPEYDQAFGISQEECDLKTAVAGRSSIGYDSSWSSEFDRLFPDFDRGQVDSQLLDLLIHFVGEKWWYRIQTAREVVVQSRVFLMRGLSRVYNWIDFFGLLDNLLQRSVWRNIKTYMDYDTTLSTDSEIARHLFSTRTLLTAQCRWRDKIQNPYVLRIEEWIYLFRFHYAERPRDRMFTLLNMSSDARQQLLVVDYSQSTWKVFARHAKYILERGIIDFMCLGTCKKPKAFQSLPSWVPDLSEAILDRPIPLHLDTCLNQGHRLDSASGSKSATASTDRLLLHLMINGVEITSIIAIAAVSMPTQSQGNRLLRDDRLEVWEQWKHFFAVHPCTAMCPICSGNPQAPHITNVLNADRYIDPQTRRFARDGPSPRWTDDTRPTCPKYPNDEIPDYDPHYNLWWWTTLHRRPIRTVSGHLGLVPDFAQEGDMICVLYGCSTPVVLRKNEDQTTYTFIGDW